MLVKELVVKLQNKPGELHRVVSKLAVHGVDIKAVTCIKVSDEETKVKVITINPEEAGKALEQEGIEYSFNKVIIADVEDKVGELAKILDLIKNANLNIEYVYTTFTYLPCHVLVVIDVDDSDKALEILRENHITIVSDHTIKKTDACGAYYEERDIQEYLSTVITP